MIIEERTLITVGWDRMMYSLAGDLEACQHLWRKEERSGNEIEACELQFLPPLAGNMEGAWESDVDHLNLLED
jgi:hypothetical protein